MTTLTGRRSRALLVLGAAALLACLSGCTGATASPPRLSAADSEAAYEDWLYEFESCMKDEGVDLSQGQDGVDAAMFQAAQKSCTDEVGEAPAQDGAPGADAVNEGMLAFAKCMREAGYAFDDPRPQSDGSVAMGAMPSGEVDPAVVTACTEKTGFGMEFGSGR